MTRHPASWTRARELARVRSTHLAGRRQRPIQANVCSTTHRRHETVKPLALGTISIGFGSPGSCHAPCSLEAAWPLSANTVLTGSGAPRSLSIPFHSTRLKDSWPLDTTTRLATIGGRLWLDIGLVKERPARTAWQRPCIVGMDANDKGGFVFSNGQQVGQAIHERIRTFDKRQKRTFKEVFDRWRARPCVSGRLIAD